ncbi:MAG: hypothetical protein IIC13_13865 [SAR324 cluster bacterium]|nr:hypothetical protein [SAR324 cluster bacterium]
MNVIENLVHLLVDDEAGLHVFIPAIAIQAVPGANRTGSLGMNRVWTFSKIACHDFILSSADESYAGLDLNGVDPRLSNRAGTGMKPHINGSFKIERKKKFSTLPLNLYLYIPTLSGQGSFHFEQSRKRSLLLIAGFGNETSIVLPIQPIKIKKRYSLKKARADKLFFAFPRRDFREPTRAAPLPFFIRPSKSGPEEISKAAVGSCRQTRARPAAAKALQLTLAWRMG